MLQLAAIRQNPEWVKERLKLKLFKNTHLIDELLHWDDNRKTYQTNRDQLLSTINTASREIGQLMAAGNTEAAKEKKHEVAALKSGLDDNKLSEAEENILSILYQLPNLPHALVPAGKTPDDNLEVRRWGTVPTLDVNALPHWELLKKYNLAQLETGTKITGSGFPVYIGQGARLQRGLIQYFLDYNTQAGYIEYIPPFLVNEASAFGTGQLPDKEGQMYVATEDKLYLIPTAEVPVTNIYRDTLLKADELPIKMTAWSPCFRREAGSYGKDVRGLNRVHQFEKVEIIQITHPDKSSEALDEMVSHVEGLLQSLQLPCRILRLCGGDMGFASAITYDFEVFSAAQQRWLEVSSVSNFETFQSNRMKCRYKDENGKNQLVHTLNGSSLALPRIYAALLENFQQSDGIHLPEVLHKYLPQVIC
jgi:seryl-tRNA synthetase